MVVYGSPSATISQGQLRTWLDEAVAYAEARFGARDPQFTLYGPFPDALGPICNPTRPDGGAPFVTVFVSEGSARSQSCAFFECAHEAVHLLTPRPGAACASLFEEGLATWASVSYLWLACAMDVRSWLGPRYAEALTLVEPLLGEAAPRDLPSEQQAMLDLHLAHIPLLHAPVPAVLALRARATAISDATTDDLQAVWPTMDRTTAERLAGSSGEMRDY